MRISGQSLIVVSNRVSFPASPMLFVERTPNSRAPRISTVRISLTIRQITRRIRADRAWEDLPLARRKDFSISRSPCWVLWKSSDVRNGVGRSLDTAKGKWRRISNANKFIVLWKRVLCLRRACRNVRKRRTILSGVVSPPRVSHLR